MGGFGSIDWIKTGLSIDRNALPLISHIFKNKRAGTVVLLSKGQWSIYVYIFS